MNRAERRKAGERGPKPEGEQVDIPLVDTLIVHQFGWKLSPGPEGSIMAEFSNIAGRRFAFPFQPQELIAYINGLLSALPPEAQREIGKALLAPSLASPGGIVIPPGVNDKPV